jgi:hypothetical protein
MHLLARFARSLFFVVLLVSSLSAEGMKTWDAKYSIENIEVTMVYYVPSDREPLPDWKERIDYFSKRIELFHAREFQGQSKLVTKVLPEPFISKKSTQQIRAGDGDHTFFTTLREVDATLKFAATKDKAFPILLVLSEINWRPLDDFYRLEKKEGKYQFEGSMNDQWHVPGAAAGGARATYLANRGVGWGLVSADGWRVPYRGSDCVVYHEGVGHTVGMPHPEPGSKDVMSFGQYNGWLSESYVDLHQKRHLGWQAPENPVSITTDLYSKFTALPEPVTPQPHEPITLRFTWPEKTELSSLKVQYQTDVLGPWQTLAEITEKHPPEKIRFGQFDRATPVSYRINVTLADGQTTELWGYFQVRSKSKSLPLPPRELAEFAPNKQTLDIPQTEQAAVDLLALIQPDRDRVLGDWKLVNGLLESPKAFGARLEIPYEPPAEYVLQIIAEPLDAPNGFLVGNRLGKQRFAALVNYVTEKETLSALENIDGENVGNSSTVTGAWLKEHRPTLFTYVIKKESVTIFVDGHPVVHWQGKPEELSLGEYWKTPRDNALFLGAYDCRYRYSRITLTPIAGQGKVLDSPK